MNFPTKYIVIKFIKLQAKLLLAYTLQYSVYLRKVSRDSKYLRNENSARIFLCTPHLL